MISCHGVQLLARSTLFGFMVWSLQSSGIKSRSNSFLLLSNNPKEISISGIIPKTRNYGEEWVSGYLSDKSIK